jgi:hypothetical protein
MGLWLMVGFGLMGLCYGFCRRGFVGMGLPA